MPPALSLILGSQSPRRRDILNRLGIRHEVVTPEVDESVVPGEKVGAYLPRVVLAKLASVRARLAAAGGPARAGDAPDVRGEGRVILVADTSVVLGDAILGKPESAEEGLAMIRRLSGRTHEVHTRFALGRGADVLHAETVVSGVTFREIREDEQRAYVATGEGNDRAGGYAVQERACGFVTRIDGSYTNVEGLPACEVLVALQALGLV